MAPTQTNAFKLLIKNAALGGDPHIKDINGV